MVLLSCFKCKKVDTYDENKISHVTTILINDKRKYINDYVHLCFKCSPEYMVCVKQKIIKDKEFEINKCDLCNNPTVNKNYGSLSPYFCYDGNNYYTTCGCIFK